MKIHQAGALQGDARLGDQPLQESQVTRPVAAGITTDGERPGYSGLGDERHDDPASLAVGLEIQPSLSQDGPESGRKQKGTPPTREIEQGTPVGRPRSASPAK